MVTLLDRSAINCRIQQSESGTILRTVITPLSENALGFELSDLVEVLVDVHPIQSCIFAFNL